MYNINTPPRCPVRGHDHDLIHISTHTQENTGEKANKWECPGGAHRWFLVGDRGPSKYNHTTRPRYGWKK